MKMNFRQKNKNDTGVKLKTIVVGVCFVVLSSLIFFFPTFSRSFVRGIIHPVAYIQDSILSGVHMVSHFFVFKSSLIKENIDLANQVADLNLKMSDYETFRRENQELKNLSGATSSTAPYVDRLLVRVISKPPRSPFDTFVLDAGSAEGIMPGARAYISDTVLVGLVTDVTLHTSLVTLFSANNQKTYTDMVRTGASYEITGQGGANLQLIVPKDTDIVWGDIFVYPKKSVGTIGTVYYIDTTSPGSFKTVFIRMPENVFSKKWMFIEK